MISIPVQTKAYIIEDEHIKILENIEKNLTLAKSLIKVIEGTMHYYSKITRYEQTNLKLYEVAFNLEEYVDKYFSDYEGETWEIFNWFCEDEFMLFEEYLKENDIVMNYIGRTSSFYFGLKNGKGHYRADELFEMIEESGKERIKWNEVIQSGEYLYVLDSINDDTKATDIVKNYIEEHSNMNDFDLTSILEEIETGTEEFVDILEDEKHDLDNFQEDIIKVKNMYEFLEHYKENQLENFKEFLINRQENY